MNAGIVTHHDTIIVSLLVDPVYLTIILQSDLLPPTIYVSSVLYNLSHCWLLGYIELEASIVYSYEILNYIANSICIL
jgi:hypothetical protein